jgi:hypothetical protein
MKEETERDEIDGGKDLWSDSVKKYCNPINILSK